MVTLKIQVKENPDKENDMLVKLITPKDLTKSTDQEQALAKWIVEQINEMFNKCLHRVIWKNIPRYDLHLHIQPLQHQRIQRVTSPLS